MSLRSLRTGSLPPTSGRVCTTEPTWNVFSAAGVSLPITAEAYPADGPSCSRRTWAKIHQVRFCRSGSLVAEPGRHTSVSLSPKISSLTPGPTHLVCLVGDSAGLRSSPRGRSSHTLPVLCPLRGRPSPTSSDLTSPKHLLCSAQLGWLRVVGACCVICCHRNEATWGVACRSTVPGVRHETGE